MRTPLKVLDDVTLERYFANYDYLRVIVTSELLPFEYYNVSSGLSRNLRSILTSSA